MIAPPYVTTLNQFDAGRKAVGHKIMSSTDWGYPLITSRIK
jgi:hypothetical protein